MRRKIKIATLILLLAGSAILCAVRWQAWFGMQPEPEWTGDTLVHSFVTFANETIPGFTQTPRGWEEKTSTHSLDILVFGDIHNNLTKDDYSTIAARHPQIDIVAQAGDWLQRGQFFYYQQLLQEWLATPLCKKPVINCPGNHEYTKGIGKNLPTEWYTWFPHPLNGPLDHMGSMYYVDFPQLRFIVMDTSPLNRIVYLTRTLTWLQKAINTAGDRYIVVMMHHPILAAAEGRFNTLIYAAFRYASGQTDLVISGHDHVYMRHMPFLVLNTAGKLKQPRLYPNCDYATTEPVYCILSIPANTSPAHLCTYRVKDGKLIDSCHVYNRRSSSISTVALR